MKSVIEKLNEVLNENTRLSLEAWNEIKEQMRKLDNHELRHLSKINNPVVAYLAKYILRERGAIKIPDFQN